MRKKITINCRFQKASNYQKKIAEPRKISLCSLTSWHSFMTFFLPWIVWAAFSLFTSSRDNDFVSSVERIESSIRLSSRRVWSSWFSPWIGWRFCHLHDSLQIIFRLLSNSGSLLWSSSYIWAVRASGHSKFSLQLLILLNLAINLGIDSAH